MQLRAPYLLRWAGSGPAQGENGSRFPASQIAFLTLPNFPALYLGVLRQEMMDGVDNKSQLRSHHPNRSRIRFLRGACGCCRRCLFHPTLLQHLGFGFGAGTGMAATPLSRSPATAKPHAVSRSVPQFPHPMPESPTGIRSPVPPRRGRARSRCSPGATVSVPPTKIHPAPNAALSSAAALPGLMRLSRRVGLHREKPGISQRCHNYGRPRHQQAKLAELGGTGTKV